MSNRRSILIHQIIKKTKAAESMSDGQVPTHITRMVTMTSSSVAHIWADITTFFHASNTMTAQFNHS